MLIIACTRSGNKSNITFKSMLFNYHIKKINPRFQIRFTHTKMLPEYTKIVSKHLDKPLPKPMPLYQSEARINGYLSEAHNLVQALGSSSSHTNLVDLFCKFDKMSTTEQKAKFTMFYNFSKKKSLPIHTIYNTLLKNEIIQENIQINPDLNCLHDCVSFYELKILSRLCSQLGIKGYYYQTKENQILEIKISTRQSIGDGYILVFDPIDKRMFLRGVDIKLGALKENRASCIYPIVLDEMDNVLNILNSNINIPDYFEKKIMILDSVMEKVTHDVRLQNKYLELQSTLYSENSLHNKFSKLNQLNTELTWKYPGTFNSEFVVTFKAHQPNVQISPQGKTNFIKNKNTFYSLKADQAAIAQYLRTLEQETQDSGIEKILVTNSHNLDPAFLDMFIGMRDITKYY